MTTFENERGGRVAITFWELGSSFGVSFCSPRRAIQLRQVIHWLLRGGVDVLVRGGAYPLSLRRDLDDRRTTLLGLLNLSLDPWPSVTWELSDIRRVESLQWLSPEGHWESDRHLSVQKRRSSMLVRAHRMVPFNQPLFVVIRWQSLR